MKIPIVNENDEIIGAKDRLEIQSGDIYRVSAIWITNSRGEILLAQRSFNKQNSPGKWGPAVAGTVEENETYEENAKKEIAEELGLENIELTTHKKIRVRGKHNFFDQWFIACIEKNAQELQIKKDEVEQVAWFDKHELLKDYASHPEKYVPSFGATIDLFLK